ncbi:hypothetical protein DID88_008298 [Monilinia fructigena]|uniref:Uncharacterized protein n=1 Tax=Monilinia fructigena TaxID=38457 RepID=A0A395J7B8_9HELO|nr:hypothetical protein DID88_008298 [Monilinia fructigena]
MCYYYQYRHTCTHTAKVLAKFCSAAGYKQTECGMVKIWQVIWLRKDCDECSHECGSIHGKGEKSGAEPIMANVKGRRGRVELI